MLLPRACRAPFSDIQQAPKLSVYRGKKRQTLNVPAGEDGLTWTFEFPSDSGKRKESTESCASESGLVAPQLQENDDKRMWKKRRQLPVQKKDV